MDKLLTPAQAAELLSVSPVTLRYWSKEGRLNFVTTLGGHRRYERIEIEKVLGEKLVSCRKKHIVIVENDRQNSELLADYIAVLCPNVEICIAYSGFEAGTMIQALQPCLVFLDIVMLDIDGFSVCQQIKANNITKNLKIIAMSDYADQQQIDKIITAGADTFLMKPIKLVAFKAVVDECLQQ